MADTPTRDEPTPDATTLAAPTRQAPSRTYERGKKILRDANGKITGLIEDAWIDTSPAGRSLTDEELAHSEAPVPFGMFRKVLDLLKSGVDHRVTKLREERAQEIAEINQAFLADRMRTDAILTRLTMCERDVALKTGPDVRIGQLISKLSDVEQ